MISNLSKTEKSRAGDRAGRPFPEWSGRPRWPKRLLLAALISGFAFTCGAQDLTVENETLLVKWKADSGQITLASKQSGQPFLEKAKLIRAGGEARKTSFRHDVFGAGEAIDVVHPNGDGDRVMLFPRLPFALFQSRLRNGGSEAVTIRDAAPLTARVTGFRPAARPITLGTGGLLPADKNPGSYVWLAVADPETRTGVVFGWLTEERGSGVVFSDPEEGAVRIRTRLDYGRLRLPPGKTEALETLAVGYFADARLGLEQWADALARANHVRLKPQPTGYCTWYSRPHGGASDEKHLAELAAFAARELAPFGFSVVQIDDHWQAGYKRDNPGSPKKNFTTFDPNGPYPHGMKAAADQVRSLGLTPGLWFMPFAGTPGDPLFDQHPEWFVKTPAGELYDTPWGGTSLDMTQPGARAHLREVASRICREWGFGYIKIDGLWTGTATKQLYVNSGYKLDDLGEAVFHDPDQTPIEAYREGLRLVREAAGPEVYILGCNGPQNMRSYGGAFGLVDGMRIGPDNGPEWNQLLRGPTFGSRHYFLHGRVWHNDPDPVYVRDSMPLDHARLICSWVALSGQLNLSSEWLPGLPPERLEILKRTMPPHGQLARPVDLFENDPPRIWLVTDSRSNPPRQILGFFNWTDAAMTFDESLEHLGLSPGTECDLFDYWQNTLLPALHSHLRLEVPAQSCRVLALRPRANHPQVLSTSRHVTQGMVDLIEERWDPANRTLTGRSRVIGGDPCELRLTLPPGAPRWRAVEFKITEPAPASAASSFATDGSLIRARINSPESGEVGWVARFAR